MNKLLLVGLGSAFAVVMSACSAAEVQSDAVTEESTSADNANEGAVSDPYAYEVDGVPSSAADVAALSARGTVLRYVMPSADDDRTVRVFTTDAGFEKYTNEDRAAVAPNSLCISLRTKTTAYDLTGFGGDSQDFTKGTSISNLSSIVRPSGATWLNDISSAKLADCVYTRFYVDPNFQGSVLQQKGGKIDPMPAGFNNTISSLVVEN